MALSSGRNVTVYRATRFGLVFTVVVDSNTGIVLDQDAGTTLSWTVGLRWASAKPQLYGQQYVIEKAYSE